MAEFFASNAIWAIWIIFGLFFLAFLLTAPCHAVLLLPFAGLPLFWLLPIEYALPVNIVAWLATPFLYQKIGKAMKKPVQDGFRSLIGTGAEVVSRTVVDDSIRYLIRSQGELWSAYCTDILNIGEQVKIVAVKGVAVVVERGENGSSADKAGAEDDRRYCH